MVLKRWKEALIGCIFIILSIVMYVEAGKLPPNLLGGMGPDFMPKVVSSGMGILGILQLITGIRRSAAGEKSGEPEDKNEEDQPEYLRVLLTVLAFGIYVFTMQSVGFLLTSVIYFFIQMMILSPKEKRRPVLYAIISLVFTVAVYFIFRNGLNVMLPRGILG